MKFARLYARTSRSESDLETQVAQMMATAAREGYYVAGTYREFGSGATADRPELQRLISDLQAGETVIATRMDRITQLPLSDAEELIKKIASTGATLSVPGVVDLLGRERNADGMAKLILQDGQKLILRLVLQSARDSYENFERGRQETLALFLGDSTHLARLADQDRHDRIVALRLAHYSVSDTAKLSGCSVGEVTRVCAKYRATLRCIRTANAGTVEQTGNPEDRTGQDRTGQDIIP